MKIVFICLNLFLKRVECFNISSSVMHLLSFEKELWIAKVEKCCRIFRWKLSPPECVHISFFYFTFKLTFQLSLHGTYPVGSSYQKYSLFFNIFIFYYLYSTWSNGPFVCLNKQADNNSFYCPTKTNYICWNEIPYLLEEQWN